MTLKITKCVALLCLSETRVFFPSQNSSAYVLAGDELILTEEVHKEIVASQPSIEKCFRKKKDGLELKGEGLRSGVYEINKQHKIPVEDKREEAPIEAKKEAAPIEAKKEPKPKKDEEKKA